MITLHDDVAAIDIRNDERLLLRYVYQPQMESDLSPRPYLHPVNTPSGITVTDIHPADHRWHMGISFAIPDVGGTNFWGGPTYVSGKGYTMLNDHGRIAHVDWQERDADRTLTPTPLPQGEGLKKALLNPFPPGREGLKKALLNPLLPQGEGGLGDEGGLQARLGATLAHTLHWIARDGATIIHEARQIDVRLLPNENAYTLTFAFTLRNVTAAPLRLASPAANGEPNGIGYGGLFWRGAPSFLNGRIINEQGEGETLRGSRSAWLGYESPQARLLFIDHPANPTYPNAWFVRNQQYPGVCFSLAAPQAYILPPHTPLTLRYSIVIADGAMDKCECIEMLLQVTKNQE